MKFLTDRKEIAQLVNLEDIPVITFNVDRQMPGYENCYEGSRIKVVSRLGAAYAERCTARIFGDEQKNKGVLPWFSGKIVLTCPGFGIKSSFGYSDVVNMVDWSNTRTVKAGDRVIVFFRSDAQEIGFLRLMKVSAVDPNCSTVATLIDCD